MKAFRRLWITLALTLLVLAACAPGAGLTSPYRPYRQETPTPPPPEHGSGSDTLNLLHGTIIPPRDRIDLARRLLGVTNIPEPPTQAPAELNLGDLLVFNADNLDEDYEFEVKAELVYKTAHVYMFVEQGYDVDRDAIQRSADNFENNIIPRMHAVFGSEWSPGIDADPHLYILHASNLGSWVAAYYGSESQFPQEAVETSNEHEMFYVNLDAMDWAIGTPYYEGVLAHEFQHMIHWSVDANEDLWLNEGLSELATMLTGYGPSDFAEDFLSQPALQLNTWPEDDSEQGAHYGASFLFTAYFYERYGEEATSTLVSNPENGLQSIEDTLEAVGAIDPTTGAPVDLVDIFGDWLVTNLLQDGSVGDGRYTYTFSDLSSIPNAPITATAQANGTPVDMESPQWGANYIRIKGSGDTHTVHLSFDGSDTVSLVPTQAHSGDYMWWSNRADDSDMRLTRAFDLTGATSATLNYWAWYYIEDRWDYGYVMVSPDNGTTWEPLSTTRTTTDNPHSNAYGPGYTGQSDWVQESVDLSAYAGQQILVRFEYITDDAITQPGLIIDDISIPEIGYTDDVEAGDGGWISEGWLRMNNELPQYFLIQLVQTDNTEAPVTRLLSEGELPEGEWDITVGGDMGDATIVISGLAPVTTEPAAYTYTLSAAD